MTAALLTNNLELLARADGGVQRIRRMVLNMAVRGTLVPQDSGDKPAADLLKEIANRKSEAVRSGSVPRPTKLSEGNPATIPFEVPVGWAWARIEDVALYVQRGKSPIYAEHGRVRVISQKCVQWSGFDADKARAISDDSLDGYGAERFLIAGDLLWNSTGTGTVGRVNVLADELEPHSAVADSHVTVIRTGLPRPEFLQYWIGSTFVQSTIDEITSGSTNQQELNASTVRRHLVPVPPSAEQVRIVDAVAEVFRVCDRLRDALAADADARKLLAEAIEEATVL